MKIDFCSDLHVDAWMRHTILRDPEHRMWAGEPFKSMFYHIDWRQYKSPDSNILVIAGDIANTMVTSHQVVAAAAEEYEYVVVVEGNHDHYSNDMNIDDAMSFFESSFAQYPNVHYLKHDKTLEVDGVMFIGATGWYDFKAYEDRGIYTSAAKRMWKTYSNDSRYPNFNGKEVEILAVEQAINLAAQAKAASEDDKIHSIVVTTHMSPRADLMEWKDGDNIWNGLTPSYVNTALKQVLDADVNNKIRLWVYGHTHMRQMVELDGIVYANNARGYPRENPPFTLTQIEVTAK